MFGGFGWDRKDKKLTFEGGAEVFWADFIRPIQGGY